MKSGMLFFGMLLTFMLAANLTFAQSCQPASCAKMADKTACSKATNNSTAAVTVEAILNASIANSSATTACSPDKCTEEQKKKCGGTCPPGCCANGAKSMKTAEVKTPQKDVKSSKL